MTVVPLFRYKEYFCYNMLLLYRFSFTIQVQHITSPHPFARMLRFDGHARVILTECEVSYIFFLFFLLLMPNLTCTAFHEVT